MPFISPERRLNTGGPLTAFDDDLPMLHDEGVRAVVGLLSIPGDASVFATAGFNFKYLPLPEGKPPTIDQVNEFIIFVERQRWVSNPVVVYGEEGFGRVGTMLSAYLIHTGVKSKEAIARVRKAGSYPPESRALLQFLEKFGRAQK
jgi:atypical dual specificity phosphatase